jgi:hypothetical protein
VRPGSPMLLNSLFGKNAKELTMEIKGKTLKFLIKAGLGVIVGYIIEEKREYRIVNGKTQYRICVTTSSDGSGDNVKYTYSSWKDC